ncbi:MAG: anthranilate synthase component I [bacterium]
MYHPTKEEFIKLSKKGNLIPVYREIVADMETPVSAFKNIEGEYSYLLESVEGGEKVGRYSFLGSDPILIVKSKGNKIEIISKGKTTRIEGDPIKELKKILSAYRSVKIKGLPRFHGGFVGYFSYDIVRHIEKLPDKNPDDLKLPDMQFLLTDTILAFDHVKHKICIISNVLVEGDLDSAYASAVKKIDSLALKLSRPIKGEGTKLGKGKKLKLTSNFSRSGFETMVRKAKSHVTNGDVIQVVLSQRFSTKIKGDAFNIYRQLRTLNPSPYMYYLKFKDMKLIGSSPETMVRLEDNVANIRPIAGTRRRGMNTAEDIALEKELLSDEKEKAEHIMLVDLGRNDLGRVCKFNSIKINELMAIEKYSHVMHIASDITGELKPGKDGYDLIAAAFPAGTVTGAPKVRAMEIIDELENLRRGPYAGAVGYFDFYGNLDTCITIRTIVVKGSAVYVQAGAGIVADSVPSKEYQETLNKAKALLKAIELSQG